MARSYRYVYNARIKEGTLPLLQQLADELGFISTAPGRYQGNPSPPDMLDSLAEVYSANPQQIIKCLREAGVTVS